MAAGNTLSEKIKCVTGCDRKEEGILGVKETEVVMGSRGMGEGN